MRRPGAVGRHACGVAELGRRPAIPGSDRKIEDHRPWDDRHHTVTHRDAALTFLQLTALDGLLRALERRPALRRFCAASYTKSFGRYRAPGFRPE